jgi:nicotinate phosphoribosyltransferase
MVDAAGGRPLIEMGSRRTHEEAAVAAARAAYLAGFGSTSNLAAGRTHGVPTVGTAAHAFTLAHESEEAAFRSQVEALGVDTTLLVDTYDIAEGIRTAVRVAGPELGAVRIDSGDLAEESAKARELLDSLGATSTRIVVTSDLDEFVIAALADAPIDGYGVGTRVVTGSGHPTASMVYKLVEVDGMPVQKRSSHKQSTGGRKEALRLSRPTGTITEEVIHPAGRPPDTTEPCRVLTTPLVRSGEVVSRPDLKAARELVASGLRSLPWEGLNLSHGDPAIPTTQIRPVPS